MTDRINRLAVVLEQDVRVDDIEPLVAAIKQLRGVLKVELNVVDMDDWAAESRARAKLEQRLWEALTKA